MTFSPERRDQKKNCSETVLAIETERKAACSAVEKLNGTCKVGPEVGSLIKEYRKMRNFKKEFYRRFF
jgi:hypothetical protein